MATINSWGNVISDAAVTLNGGTLSLGTENAANAINIGLGTIGRTISIGNSAAAHIVNIGSTTGAAQMALKYGTADFTLASATGTVMSALDSGEVLKPLNPLFNAVLSATQNNVTGDGTIYTVIYDTETTDVNGDYDNTTGIFTAPVTGKYFLNARNFATGIGLQSTGQTNISTTPANYGVGYQGPAGSAAAGGNLSLGGGIVVALTAGDTATATMTYSGSTKTVGALGTACYFMGFLIA